MGFHASVLLFIKSLIFLNKNFTNHNFGRLCNNMDYYKRKESQTEDKFYKKNEQRYAEKIRDDSLIISDRELIQSIGKEDKQILWSSEKASLFFNKNILR